LSPAQRIKAHRNLGSEEDGEDGKGDASSPVKSHRSYRSGKSHGSGKSGDSAGLPVALEEKRDEVQGRIAELQREIVDLVQIGSFDEATSSHMAHLNTEVDLLIPVGA